MKLRVFYDRDSIQIDGLNPYPPRSLATSVDGDNIIIHTTSGFHVSNLEFWLYADTQGNNFPSLTAARAYLDGEFAKAPETDWDAVQGKPATFPPSAHTHAYASLTGIPSTFAPSAHTHPISDVTGLQSALDDKQVSGSYVTTTNFTWANLGGKPATFPPSAHTHSYNDLTDKPTIPTSGRMELIGTLNFSETLLVSLALGMKRRTVALAGVLANDRLVFAPTAAPTVGCEVINVYPASAGNISVGYYTPLLAIGATYSMPIAVYRITT